MQTILLAGLVTLSAGAVSGGVRLPGRDGVRTLCVLTDVTLPRLAGNWTGEEPRGGPPPNLVRLPCAAPVWAGGAIHPDEVPDVREFAVVSKESLDGSAMHGRLPVAFLVTEGGEVYFYNTLRREDLRFDVLTVEARRR